MFVLNIKQKCYLDINALDLLSHLKFTYILRIKDWIIG